MESEMQDETQLKQTPGQLLQQAREDAGFSVQYVAEQLRLTESYITWLESDQYENLPAEPFILGYFRAYARILSQPADALIESYHAHRQKYPPVIEADAVKPRAYRHTETSNDITVPDESNNRFYVIAVAVLVVIWILFSIFTGSDSEVNVSNQSVSAVVSERSNSGIEEKSEAQSADVDTAETSEHAMLEQADASVEDVTAQVSGSAVIGEGRSAAEVTVNPKSQLDRLSIAFDGECWLEVTDSNDDVVAANLYQKGDTAELLGVAPFSVMFGNIRVARVSMNDVTVETQPRGFRKTLRADIYADASIKSVE